MPAVVRGPGAQGGLVSSIQSALIAAGFDPKGVDGDYGGNTVGAVKAFQQQRQLGATGLVDETTWQLLTRRPIPATDVRALELTAAFEGHGYSLAVGNFDGAWLTWGIIGFTLKAGKVQKIVLAVDARAPQLVRDAFGDGTQALLKTLRASAGTQEAWANSVTSNGMLVEPWRTRFHWFGTFPEVQAEQQRVARMDYFEPALLTATDLGLQTQLGLALCFDIHVQNGGVGKTARAQLRRALESTKPRSEKGLRRLLADAVADSAREKYREDVRSRKACIAESQGLVHGHRYLLENWGLGESPAPELG